MKVVTEDALRRELKDKLPDKYIIGKDTIITPSARQYLRDKKVKLIVEEEKKSLTPKNDNNECKASIDSCKAVSPKYISYYSRETIENKPEYMTHIYGNSLVYKDDPRIVFRGKLDSLQSKILEVQILAHSKKVDGLVKELDEVLSFTRLILKAEVLNEDFQYDKLIGLNKEQLREMSHYPKKYFGIEHILPSFEMGEVLIGLNAIRSKIRETEINAVRAFKKDYGIERLDIVCGLNRLSSCIYIMMCKYRAGLYK